MEGPCNIAQIHDTAPNKDEKLLMINLRLNLIHLIIFRSTSCGLKQSKGRASLLADIGPIILCYPTFKINLLRIYWQSYSLKKSVTHSQGRKTFLNIKCYNRVCFKKSLKMDYKTIEYCLNVLSWSGSNFFFIATITLLKGKSPTEESLP